MSAVAEPHEGPEGAGAPQLIIGNGAPDWMYPDLRRLCTLMQEAFERDHPGVPVARVGLVVKKITWRAVFVAVAVSHGGYIESSKRLFRIPRRGRKLGIPGRK